MNCEPRWRKWRERGVKSVRAVLVLSGLLSGIFPVSGISNEWNAESPNGFVEKIKVARILGAIVERLWADYNVIGSWTLCRPCPRHAALWVCFNPIVQDFGSMIPYRLVQPWHLLSHDWGGRKVPATNGGDFSVFNRIVIKRGYLTVHLTPIQSSWRVLKCDCFRVGSELKSRSEHHVSLGETRDQSFDYFEYVQPRQLSYVTRWSESLKRYDWALFLVPF